MFRVGVGGGLSAAQRDPGRPFALNEPARLQQSHHLEHRVTG